MKKGRAYFEVYRYHILPINRFFQGNLFQLEIQQLDDLIVRKNQFFYEAVVDLENCEALRSKLIFDKDDQLVFECAARRSFTLEKQDFQKETVDNWPSFKVVLFNGPNDQFILVQERKEAFANTITVIRAITLWINKKLKAENLIVNFEPMFERHRFWDIVEKHKGNLKSITFELSTPNLSAISQTLSDDIKDLAQSTNACRMKMNLTSADDSTLKIEKDNATIGGLVDYASQGGGNVIFKAKGISRQIRTSSTTTRINIDELEVNTDSPEHLSQVLRELLP